MDAHLSILSVKYPSAGGLFICGCPSANDSGQPCSYGCSNVNDTDGSINPAANDVSDTGASEAAGLTNIHMIALLFMLTNAWCYRADVNCWIIEVN